MAASEAESLGEPRRTGWLWGSSGNVHTCAVYSKYDNMKSNTNINIDMDINITIYIYIYI